MAKLNVLNYPSLDSPVLFHQGRIISLGEILYAVEFLDEKLPQHQYLLNLYEDRYYFLLGFFLGLKRQSISLFPSTVTTHVLEQLNQTYNDILLLSEQSQKQEGFQHFDLIQLLNSEAFQLKAYSHVETETILPPVEANREVAIIFTSGSTGQPKPYHKVWSDLVQVAELLAQEFLYEAGHKTSSAILATVPAQHMYGLESSIIMALQNGLTIHAEKPFFPQDITHCLEDLQSVPEVQTITIVTTPLHLKACLKTDVRLTGVQQFISATAPLEQSLAQSCENLYGAPVREIFGCTEVGSMACRRTIETEQWTVLNDISLYTDKEDSNDVIIHTSRSIQKFPFSDIIELIDNQHFVLKGRKEDLINLAGKRTSLSYLNHHIQSFDALSDACFYQDDQRSEARLVAFIVPADNVNKTSEELVKELRAFLKTKIEAIFLPKKIFIVDSLPRNATGKLPLVALKKLFEQQD